MELVDVWFVLIAVLWTGYLCLEGFDFGVGMLLPAVTRDEYDRKVALGTIGPVWDGNEVWLLVAGGAMFAAFPEWYASLFSGFYLAFLLLLVALILRGIALEYRGKEPRWAPVLDRILTGSSLAAALLVGVALANVVRGVPLDADHEFTGTLVTLLNPYALLGGITTVLVFALHGGVFLALKTDGPVRERSAAVAVTAGVLAVTAGGVFGVWTLVDGAPLWVLAPVAVAAGGLVGATVLVARGREGWAFTATTTAIVAVAVTLFGSLYPDVLPSTTDPAFSLTVDNASSTPYTLTIMTWVAAVVTPVVLCYQAWTFWVFRRRLTRRDFVAAEPTTPEGS
ncbi:Cytochrome d ubiquinol oxidase subunit II [Pseudonocardia sp. Ae168_Ps1]|uniref:cytochrome d ubiquinol oxidase subunit II n=1 Tax=unclassified Pseudonocardia TaxID=2619320 RepID=UPI00094B1AB9|nr:MULTISPECIES: cytochrome d ubiquinol oxidase subunit II [unclassified Pseudonocardia]OLL73334.1 Cytochrome d ubiquinol oxidase subunit II [Pseudonocardia sp. Ae150A_Ps1]OLL79312.1 Cytochrome d ubiquinol oxidase subunit II [Pseudonocardia sp. Ae168_Ps1]OLL86550.1 Cytochrome d ubiquinol oxidase subunit II [Pseudonocardia sp. Ae263_Ps1]OLL93401.1 Cytochrome d ubiquinol oxidase subunit II [Pseudonocardia sp. Ae356_Ps1]